MNISNLCVILENILMIKILELLIPNIRINRYISVIIGVLLTIECFLLSFLQIGENEKLILPMITLFIFCIYKGAKVFECMFKIFLIFLNLTLLKLIIITVSTVIIGIPFQEIYNDSTIVHTLICINTIVFLIEYLFVRSCYKLEYKLSGYSMTILTLCSIVTFVMTNIILREYVLASISFTFCMSLVIVFIFFLFLVVVLCILNARYYEKNLEQSLQLESYQYEDKYINAITEKTLEYNKLNHDMKNHMNILKDLISDSHIEAAKNYMNELSIEQRHGYLHVNHLVLNYLLNDKIAQAEDNGIKLSCIIVGKPVTFISDVDYSILINNLLDNAIEGTLEAGDDEIYATFSFTENKCVIEVKNATIKKPKHKQLITSKKNKERHGIGLKNIKEVVDKYRGQDNIEVTERFFYHECILYKVD